MTWILTPAGCFNITNDQPINAACDDHT